ncbi:MAG: ferredoxin [Streptosporangiaceae bacterium]
MTTRGRDSRGYLIVEALVAAEEWAALLTRVAAGLAPDASSPDAAARTVLSQRSLSQESRTRDRLAAQIRNSTVKVQIDSGRCQGHGRCYDLAPGVFGDDDEGYGKVLADGLVPPGQGHEARLAVANCPEQAITLVEGA